MRGALGLGDHELATNQLDGLARLERPRSMSLSYSARLKRRVLAS